MYPNFAIYSCLPFVELGRNAIIEMGPILFWPSSKFKELLSQQLHQPFENYFNSIGQIKAKIEQEGTISHFDTVKLNPQVMTCISIRKDVPEHLKEFILVDSLYLLYFACIFQNLYYNQEIPHFRVFTKILPCSVPFIAEEKHWAESMILETEREESVCITIPDQEICKGLGLALNSYLSDQPNEKEIQHQRLVRAIRYFVDRFFEKFVNLIEKDIRLHSEIFEPEDVVFLASSFDTLLNISDQYSSSDFKQKVRPMLHLKYSRPVELFWKWVDGFYQLRKTVTEGRLHPNQYFQDNPNFKVSYIYLGIKLFIYSVYYTLFKLNLIPSKEIDLFTPPDFKWIHPEEILIFFMTEDQLLRKLSFLSLKIEVSTDLEESLAEIKFLSLLFVTIFEKFFEEKEGNRLIKFIPQSQNELKEHGGLLLANSGKTVLLNHQEYKIKDLFVPNFFHDLQQRLSGK